MTPVARLQISGQDADPRLMRRLVSMTITDEAGGKADNLEIEFDAAGGLIAPPIGSKIKVWLGYEPKPIYRGSYAISNWEKEGPPATLRISARASDLVDDLKARKVRSWHDMSVSAIVEQIASDNGLTAVVDDDIGAISIPHIDQQTESDMSFLTRLAKRTGATFKVGSGHLLFAAKGSTLLPDGSPKIAIELKPVDVSHWRLACEERGKFKSVITHYIDQTTGKTVSVHTGSGKPAHRDPRRYGSQAEAAAAGKATFGDLDRGKMSADIDGAGNPSLFAEALISLSTFDPDVDGEYLAKTVTHSFSGGGYTTSAHLETKGSESSSDEDAS